MRRMTRRESMIAVILVSVVGLYLAMEALYKPYRAKVQRLDVQIDKYRKQLVEDAREIRRAQSLKQEYEMLKNQFLQERSNEQVIASMISDIEQVASKLGLRISDLKPKRARSSVYYNQFSVSLTLDSDFLSVNEFLYTLQNGPYHFNVDDLRFDKGARRGASEIKTRMDLSKVFIPAS